MGRGEGGEKRGRGGKEGNWMSEREGAEWTLEERG
jgi:hypothetical protein